MLIRWFAAAEDAAGAGSTHLDTSPGMTGQEVLDLASADNLALAQVISVSTILLDGKACSDRNLTVRGHALLDVLPPFAGG